MKDPCAEQLNDQEEKIIAETEFRPNTLRQSLGLIDLLRAENDTLQQLLEHSREDLKNSEKKLNSGDSDPQDRRTLSSPEITELFLG